MKPRTILVTTHLLFLFLSSRSLAWSQNVIQYYIKCDTLNKNQSGFKNFSIHSNSSINLTDEIRAMGAFDISILCQLTGCTPSYDSIDFKKSILTESQKKILRTFFKGWCDQLHFEFYLNDVEIDCQLFRRFYKSDQINIKCIMQ